MESSPCHITESMDDREFPMIGVDNMDPKLYKAARSGNMEYLTSIVNANLGTNLNRCLTPQRNTLLHIAVKFEQQRIVQWMSQQWPSLISQPNSKGDTPLHMAARARNHDLTRLLTPASNLKEGNPAIEEGNPVRQAGGVALRMSNSEGSNPIHEALKKSHKEVALHLLAFEERHGLARDVNMAGESLLYLAAKAGLDEVVKKIIEIGDYSTQGPDGQNPLHIAVIKGRLGVVEILLNKESNFIPQADRFGNTVLHFASARNYYRGLEEGRTKDGNHIKILESLLRANPSLAYVPNRNGDYPLFIAIRKHFVSAVCAILDHCPDSAELVNQKGQNALHVAVMEKNRSILQCPSCRLEFEKMINEPDSDGNTPMHLAKCERIVKLLINLGTVDLSMSNKEGRTNMDICGYTERECSTEKAEELNAELIGCRVKVCRPMDKPYHEGMVQSYDPGKKKHVILYENEDVEVLNLDKEKWEVVSDDHKPQKHPIRDTLRESGAVPGRHQWQERFILPPTPQLRKVKISLEFTTDNLQAFSIITSLMATVTFAAAFTVPGGYKNDGPREGLPVFMRNAALQAFVLSDVLAFCSSMAATVLLLYANMVIEDACTVHNVLRTCNRLARLAILATITAFVTAVYVLTSNESLWLAVTSLLLGSTVPLFLICYERSLEK